jgi:hypothetical protein
MNVDFSSGILKCLCAVLIRLVVFSCLVVCLVIILATYNL